MSATTGEEDPPAAPPELSPDERGRLQRAVERLRRELSLTGNVEPFVPALVMALVAWSDGLVQEAEVARIREAAAECRLGERIAEVERLLAARPGPSFRHRVIHLVQALRLDGRLDDRAADELRARAREVAEAAGGFLGFGKVCPEEQDVMDELDHALSLDARSLKTLLGERRTLPIVPEWLDPDAVPRNEVHVHRTHDAIVEVTALHLGVPRTADRPWAPVMVRMDPLEHGAELDPGDVKRALVEHAHLPDSERWAVLLGLIAAQARPIDPVYRAELLAEARSAGATGEDFVVVRSHEFYTVKNELARVARWVAWHAGKLEELRIDRDVVRRRLAPGTFDAPRRDVVLHHEAPFVPSDLPGLAFQRLSLEAPGRAPLRLAAPDLPREPTEPSVAWLARFLPILRNPYETLLLDVYPGEVAHWTIDVRSSLPETFDGKAEPLPPGRCLVIPPWVWERVALAFGA